MIKSQSQFSPSVCNYLIETPLEEKSNLKSSKIKPLNLNNIYNEIDFISKDDLNEEINYLNLNKSSINYSKNQLNNNNSQLTSNNNFNSSSLSFQYSDSGKKSDKLSIIKTNKVDKKFIVQKNENLEIINSKNEYQISQCISINNIFSAFSIEISPKNKIEKFHNEELKIDYNQIFIPKKIEEKNNKEINIKLKSLSNINEKNVNTPLNLRYKELKNNSPHNNYYFKNPFSENNNEKTNGFIMKNLLKNSFKRINKSKNEENKNRKEINNLKKYIKKRKKKENKNKPNSNSDINEIMNRHFKQKSFNFNTSKEKKNSKNNKSPKMFSFSNKILKKRRISEIINNLKNQTLKINKTESLKNKQLNKKKNNNKKKIKSHINLTSILNNNNINSLNNKSNKKERNNLTGIITKNKSLNKKNLLNPNNIKKTCLKSSFDNIKILKRNNQFLKENYSNSNSYASKIAHTQETVNTTKDNNNNYITTTTNYSTNKKSPKVINDFTFYKKTVNYRAHFVSLINPRESNQNINYNLYFNNTNVNNDINKFDYKFYPKKQQPIASIKLMKLEGDIDSNISSDE